MPGEKREEDGFRPALIIVDVQEDFCPPNGALAVPQGRSILPTIAHLLSLPFTLKIATQDWHPQEHISFASTHAGSEAYTSTTTVTNPLNGDERYTTRLWPDHCIQSTFGAELVAPVAAAVAGGEIHAVVKKGLLRDVEMYSAFYPPLTNPRVADSGLVQLLASKRVTHVFVVGLAADYCVRATAVDAASEGWETVIVDEGTRAVDQEAWEKSGKEEVERLGVRIVKVDGLELERVARISSSSLAS